MSTKIEWCDETINPIRVTGGGYHCTKVSEGCQNCYAEVYNRRFGNKRPFDGTKAEFVIDWMQLAKPMHWKKPRKIFVQSMGDLFHEDVALELIDAVFAVMASCGTHTFMLLTKRPERMQEYMQRVSQYGPAAVAQYTEDLMNFHRQHMEGYTEGWTPPPPPEPEVRFVYTSAVKQEAADPEWKSIFYNETRHWRKWPLSNVWMGVTAENQARFDERVEILRQIPAAVRYVSIEPMLGPIDASSVLGTEYCCNCGYRGYAVGPEGEDGEFTCPECGSDSWYFTDAECHGGLEQDQRKPIDLIICGAESGPEARPMHPDWGRSLRDQCKVAGVSFFFKSWGDWFPFYDRDKDDPDWVGIPEDKNGIRRLNIAGGQGFHGDRVVYFKRVGKKKAGRLLDGRTWDEMPGVESC